MPELGLAIIDEAVHDTNAWLNAISDRTAADKGTAYHALRAGLHAVRDRLTAEEAVHLSQQLPLMIRGIFFEGWQPAATPRLDRDKDAWMATVEGYLARDRETEITPEAAAQAVLTLLAERIDAGEMRHLEEQLPDEVAALARAA